jgi:hypothetical protein
VTFPNLENCETFSSWQAPHKLAWSVVVRVAVN